MQPPFVAPPTDGARRRRALALWLAGAGVVVVCLGGLLGLGGLLVFGTQMIVDQSRAAVTEHLSAIQDADYKLAYDQLCERERDRLDEQTYRRSLQAQPRIQSFTVDEPILTDTIVVPAAVAYVDGTNEMIRFLLEQDTSTGAFEVCGRQG